MNKPPDIILASSSPYRRELLGRLGLNFDVHKPDVDESPLPGEAPHSLVERLSRLKTEIIVEDHPDKLVIGSDQVARLGAEILTKPGGQEAAFRQLQSMRNTDVEFITGICLYHPLNGYDSALVSVVVQFRDYEDAEIQRYLAQEQPYDCAGSFKSERLGISLVNAITTDDPTALIGLPLIRLSQMLRVAGLKIP